MKREVPKDAITLLEEHRHFSKLKSYLAAFFILFTTFAIPVTITQVYKSNTVSSSAYVSPTDAPLRSYIAATTAGQQTAVSSFNGLFSYWWIFLLGGVLLGLWVYLVVMFVKARNFPSESFHQG